MFKNIQGIVKLNIFQYKQLLLSNENVFLPLDNLIIQNDVLKSIPVEYHKSMLDNSDKTMGLYYGHRYFINVRLYNEEAMNSVNHEIPNSPEELLALLRKIQIKYKESDLSIMEFLENGAVIPLNDVFAANGCNIYDSKYTIGWDPKLESFEDSILGANIDYILNFTKQLIDENLLTQSNEISLRGKFADNRLFSTTDILTDNYLPPGRLSYHLGNESSTLLKNDFLEMYVVPVNMENGESTFNEFINSFYGNPLLNIVGKYGIDNEYNISENLDYVTVHRNESYDEKGVSLIPRISDNWPNNPYTILFTEDSEIINQNKLEAASVYYEQLNDLIARKMLAILSPLQIIDINERYSLSGSEFNAEEINNMFAIEYTKFLKSSISTRQFIDNYILQMKKAKAEDFLDWLNNRVNARRLYSY